jgi:hypothetical protein
MQRDVPSSRKTGRATYDSVAFRYVAANAHPDHDTLAAFGVPLIPVEKRDRDRKVLSEA